MKRIAAPGRYGVVWLGGQMRSGKQHVAVSQERDQGIRACCVVALT
jgi:hypothetical protein